MALDTGDPGCRLLAIGQWDLEPRPGQQERSQNRRMGKQEQLKPVRFSVDPGHYFSHRRSPRFGLAGFPMAKSGAGRKRQIC